MEMEEESEEIQVEKCLNMQDTVKQQKVFLSTKGVTQLYLHFERLHIREWIVRIELECYCN